MKSAKKKRLETKGWKVGTAVEFLQLSPEESAYIEMKLALSKNLQERRKDKRLTQEQLAHLLKSSQSRVAKMEAGDPSVSLDLLVRSLLILGESRKSLAKILSKPHSAFVSETYLATFSKQGQSMNAGTSYRRYIKGYISSKLSKPR